MNQRQLWNPYSRQQFSAPLWNFSPRTVSSPPAGWRKAWQPVSDLVDGAPPQRLQVDWPDNVRLTDTNLTISTGLVTKKPTLLWSPEPGALYTLMVVGLFDLGLPPSDRPKVFIHWVVTNIPGDAVELGTEVFDYITPFALKLDADGNIVKDAEQSNHPILLNVYKQPGKVVMEEGQTGCTQDVAQHRVVDHRNLASKYGLQLVAGNFLQVPWSGFHTTKMFCWMSRCLRKPLPFLIPNFNDMTECQPRTDVIDMTMVGPVVSSWKEYSKYRSLLSPDSVTAQIQDTYPLYSTGNIADFTAVEGAFKGAPLGTDNLAQTLEGVVDLTVLQYPDVNATKVLFDKAFELVPAIPKLFTPPALVAGGAGLKIILSKPDDQDFDFMTLLDAPGSVFQLNIVKVKEGRMEEFNAALGAVIASDRSNRNIGHIYTFEVDQEIMEEELKKPPSQRLYFDSSNNAIWLARFASLGQRQRYLAEADPAAFSQFAGLFDCIVCAAFTNALHPNYYPPFP